MITFVWLLSPVGSEYRQTHLASGSWLRRERGGKERERERERERVRKRKRDVYIGPWSIMATVVVSFKVVKPYHVGSVVAAVWKSEQVTW